MPKIEIDTDQIIIRSILDTSEAMTVNVPPLMQTNVRNLIMSIARNEIMIVQCKHGDEGLDMWVLCAHITDNPAIGEKLLPLCVVPANNKWIAALRPPPGVPKSAFVNPLASEPFALMPVNDLDEAADVVREFQEQADAEEDARHEDDADPRIIN